MARIRTVKPELPSDPTLASVPLAARLTFVYLITQADDYGLVSAVPRQLLGLLFPHDPDITERKLTTWVKGLADAGMLELCQTSEGVPVIRLVNWERHQRIDNRSRSLLRDRLVREISPRDSASHGKNPLGSRSLSYSPSKVPDPGSQDARADFELAWAAYPKRANNPKAKAWKAYAARRKSGVTAEELLAGVRAYAAYCEREGIDPKFIKQGATFFGPDEHWLTDYASVGRESPAEQARRWAAEAQAERRGAA